MVPRTAHRTDGRAVQFLGTLVMLVALAVFALPMGTAQAKPAMVSASHAAALAKPAVVRIITDVSGQITARINGEDTPLPQVPKGLVGASGSGAFISPDGFVLTADHVVEGTTDGNRSALRLATAYLLSRNSDYTMSEWRDYLDTLDSDGALQYKVQTSPTVYLSAEYLGPSLQHLTRLPVTRIVASSPFWFENDNKGQDVAVVQVQATNMPYLTLAPSADVGAAATALGFPGNADVNSDFLGVLEAAAPDLNSATGLLTPSETSGTIQAEKPMPNGTMIYETSGISSPGSSGGPLIDSQGRIDGIASFSTSSTSQVGGWIVSSVLAMYVPSHVASGPLMARWTTAMNDFYATSAGHWGKALNDLKAIRTDYPEFGGVTPYLDQAQAKAATEPKPEAKGGFPIALLIVGIVVLALLIAGGVGGFMYMLRRRGQAPTGGPVAPPTVPMQPYGAPQMLAQPPTVTPQFDQLPSSQPVSASPFAQPLTPVPFAQPVTAPPILQSVSAPGVPVAGVVAPVEEHVCLNGHVVLDPTAHFCSECGAEVRVSAHA